MIRTGLGPYRRVADAELRPIFYLTEQKGKAFMVSFSIGPFAGANDPVVTPLLRAMLYVRLANGQQRQELAKEIEKRLADRAMIPIRAKLLSLIRDVAATPWAYPACLTTEECKTYWREMNKIAGWSAIPSDRTGDAVSGLGLSALLKRLPQMAFGSALLNQFGGQSKDYYDSYARRLSDELALRGVPPSTLE